MTQGVRQKSVLVTLLLAGVFILSFRLDPVAGNVPQQPAIYYASSFFSFLGEGLVLLSACVLLYILGLGSGREALKKGGLTALASVLLGGVAVQLLKAAFERPRVSQAVVGDAVLQLLEDPFFFDITGKFNSFPSGHSAVSFAFASALGSVFPRWRAPLYVFSSLVAVARVSLGSHYPSDVVAGALLGLWAGYLVTGARERRAWLTSAVLFLSIFIAFFKTGGLLLFDVDEAVFSEASREMLETGGLITPTYNYEPRYDKPILIYWLISASLHYFGVSEFSARLPSSFFGVLLSVMTFFFVRRAAGRTLPAYLSSLALLINTGFFVYSHSATTDMTLAFFISASLFSFYTWTTTGERKYLAAFWAAAALATLTKGAIGLVFPIAISFVYLLGSRKAARGLFNPALIALYLVITLPWFTAAYYTNGWEFIEAFFIKHHIRRYTEVISGHTGPLYYYAGVLLLGFYPWAVFIPAGLLRGLRGLRATAKGGLYLFASVWFLTVFLFFSFATTKLPNYVFPLFPAASVMAGLLVADVLENGKRAHLYAVSALSVVFAIAVFLVPSLNIKMDVYFPPASFYTLAGLFAITGLSGLIPGKRAALIGIWASSLLLLVFLRLHVVPPLNSYMQKDLYTYARHARGFEDATLLTYEINNPSISFYSEGPVVKVERSSLGLLEEYTRERKVFVITSRKRHGELKDIGALRTVGEGEQYVLLSNF